MARDVRGRARRRHRRARARATTACCRCTASCSSRRIRSPPSGRSPRWASSRTSCGCRWCRCRRSTTRRSAPRCAKRAASPDAKVPRMNPVRTLRRAAARAAPPSPSPFALAGCESTTTSLGKKIDYKSVVDARRRSSCRPTSRRRSTTTATTVDHGVGPRARRRDAPARAAEAIAANATPDAQIVRARHRALAGRQGHAGAGVEHVTRQFWLENGLRARGRAAAGRHHGNRLGGEPRRACRSDFLQQHDRQVRRRLLHARTSATSSARASSAAPSRAPSRSTSRTAAWSRCRRPRSTTRRRRRSPGR